ncbi:hypothetical protein Y032_0431g1336 [Ancylostoma ceylanicum]|uniref:Uncharacterized protein n=1 Tax=Ancylostoma ceylanicum TaxID=53326 RepID=A0A016X0I1_9BILA|nr:hypothetical protein Y032_0431g1336 [Ancylostoma ceylanicum]
MPTQGARELSFSSCLDLAAPLDSITDLSKINYRLISPAIKYLINEFSLRLFGYSANRINYVTSSVFKISIGIDQY